MFLSRFMPCPAPCSTHTPRSHTLTHAPRFFIHYITIRFYINVLYHTIHACIIYILYMYNVQRTTYHVPRNAQGFFCFFLFFSVSFFLFLFLVWFWFGVFFLWNGMVFVVDWTFVSFFRFLRFFLTLSLSLEKRLIFFFVLGIHEFRI